MLSMGQITDNWEDARKISFLPSRWCCSPPLPHTLSSVEGCKESRGSSGSIVYDYELDDWGSIPDRCRGFFF
jgi:hypothetical protein